MCLDAYISRQAYCLHWNHGAHQSKNSGTWYNKCIKEPHFVKGQSTYIGQLLFRLLFSNQVFYIFIFKLSVALDIIICLYAKMNSLTINQFVKKSPILNNAVKLHIAILINDVLHIYRHYIIVLSWAMGNMNGTQNMKQALFNIALCIFTLSLHTLFQKTFLLKSTEYV